MNSVSHFLRVLGVAGVIALLAACETFGSKGAGAGPAESTQAEQIDAQIRQAAIRAEAQNNYLEAAQHYQSLLSRNPDDLELAISLARNLRYAGSNRQDTEIINALIAKYGRTPRLLTELGKSYVSGDNMNLAIPVLEEASRISPDSWDTYSTLGVAYDYEALFDKAREAYSRALLLSPRNPDILNNLALSQAQSGDLDGALETLSMAVDQPSASPQIRQNLALMLALKGNVEEAERWTRKDLTAEQAEQNVAYYRYLATRK